MRLSAALRRAADARAHVLPHLHAVSELRRRKGRTLLTALGLGVGVGLVVTVSAPQQGPRRGAGRRSSKPLTGVGTDMSVTRPLKFMQRQRARAASRQSERDQLQKENGPRRFDLANAGRAGGEVHPHRLHVRRAAQLPGLPGRQDRRARRGRRRRRQPHAQRGHDQGHGAGERPPAARRCRAGRPPRRRQPPTQRAPFDVDSISVTGVDESKPRARRRRRAFHAGYAREAVAQRVLRQAATASRSATTVTLDGKTVQRSSASPSSPLGGQASDVYVKLAQLQKLSDREGRVNTPPGPRRLDATTSPPSRRRSRATMSRRVGDHRRRPRRPRRRLARRRQEPVGASSARR